MAMAGLSRHKPLSIGATKIQGDTSAFKKASQLSTVLTDILYDLRRSNSASLRPADSDTNNTLPAKVAIKCLSA